MSISTKRGDDGTTSLLFNRRVSKTHPRVLAYGGVDELGSALALCRAHSDDGPTKAQLLQIQQRLTPLMSELASDDKDQARYLEKAGRKALSGADVSHINSLVLDKESGIHFEGWSYAGETTAEAFFDQARTTCRRAERGIVALKESGGCVRPELLQFLNRLADLLWLWACEHSKN